MFNLFGFPPDRHRPPETDSGEASADESQKSYMRIAAI
jgi:hypothetical protein